MFEAPTNFNFNVKPGEQVKVGQSVFCLGPSKKTVDWWLILGQYFNSKSINYTFRDYMFLWFACKKNIRDKENMVKSKIKDWLFWFFVPVIPSMAVLMCLCWFYIYLQLVFSWIHLSPFLSGLSYQLWFPVDPYAIRGFYALFLLFCIVTVI